MTVERPLAVALDGPAASGKSSVGLAAARELGFLYFDTGLLYRALAWVALQRGVDPANGRSLGDLARTVRFEVRPPRRSNESHPQVLADGEDVSEYLHLPEVDRVVSPVAVHPEVREALIEPQRAAVQAPGTILAGRDIGTVIVPDAPLKIWLSASAQQRAHRRARQTGEAYDAVLSAMQDRDRIDSTRAAAPMRKADDAVEIDTDQLSLESVVERIVALARERSRSSST